MAKLTGSQRDKLPTSKFGLPARRAYPMPDRSHAINAKARASQQVKRGNLSRSQEESIDAMANRLIKEHGF